MTDIKNMPLQELLDDRAASINDIVVCQSALDHGITHHKSGLSVQERLDVNKNIVSDIDSELMRRKETL